MKNAWRLSLAALALAACNGGGTTTGTDAAVVDGGGSQVDAARTDGGGGGGNDANLPPYDGGPAFSCTGLAPLMPSGYCAAYADAVVAQRMRCGLIGATGATELRAAVLAGCDISTLEAAVTSGSVQWNAANAACCLGHSANDTSCFLDVGSGDESCDFITGTVAVGGDCTSNAQCMDSYCHVEDSCPGTCTAYAAPGTECDFGDVVCDAQSTCDTGYNGATNVCIRQTGAVGAQCRPAMGEGCEADLDCYDPSGSGTGTCRRRPTRGEACDTDSIVCDFNSAICDYDFASDTGVCVPAFAIGTMRCLIDAQCAGDAYCDGEDFNGMVYGTCRERPHRGESCANAPCVAGTVCNPGSICGDAPTVGEACIPAIGCDNGRCNGSGMCVALLAAGEPCSKNDQCASGNCRENGHVCAPDCTP